MNPLPHGCMVVLSATNYSPENKYIREPDKRGERDALIAATALVHGMTVVTRKVADFKPTGVILINPWEVS